MLLALKNAFSRLGASQTLRLLVLEFVVILGGVLAAQLLQDRFARNAEREAAEAQFESIAAALHNSAELAIIRPRMNLCMRDAIERVRDVLAVPGADRSELGWLETPEQMVLDETGIDAARPLLARHLEGDWMMRLSSAEYMNAYMRQGQDDELEAWSTLKLLRPENGPIDEATRGVLLRALGEAERANRLLVEVSGVMASRASELDTPTHDTTINGMAYSPKLCMAMVGYEDEAHGEAAQRGELPDGRPIHPRVLQQLAEDAEWMASARARWEAEQAAQASQAEQAQTAD
ncbi:hypothetical protein [Aurantiacibacter sediminis]|uniref:Uncharacterized protein n=1 Tax=Aurantiacibacter sediminis TaxID=2793064 RepID=A0ABS0N6I7_9SPHN|nr:hypothetical protein [Aurantiacibacter sediminis]MBH5323367.1 hypothetical protein [Aurantiacibacter sediminis]